MQHRFRHTILYISMAVVVIVVLVWAFNFPREIAGTKSLQNELTAGTSSVPRVADFNHTNRIDFQSEIGITATDRKAVYEAILKGYQVLMSKDVTAVRTYLKKKAASPADTAQIDSLSNEDIISLSNRLSSIMTKPKDVDLLTPDARWTRTGDTMTIEFVDSTKNATTTLRAVFRNGGWL